MLSVDQRLSRLFRPWDASDKNEDGFTKLSCDKTNMEGVKTKKEVQEEKRENRLRKIRGHFKRSQAIQHQDDTVSTTTVDIDDDRNQTDARIREESPVANLSLICDRLLGPSEKKTEVKELPKTHLKQQEHQLPNIPMQPVLPAYSNYHPTFLPEFIPDIAQALGVPTSDPLLLESLAQGYAMEYEYARILHQENEMKLLNSKKQRPKKYKCPHCQVGFSNNGQLKGHIRIHTGERPYKCEEKNCGKTFTRNEELTRHKRIHSGVRPYPCQTCGKKFGRRDHLKKHTRTHFMQAERMMPVFVPLSAVPQVPGFPYLYGY